MVQALGPSAFPELRTVHLVGRWMFSMTPPATLSSSFSTLSVRGNEPRQKSHNAVTVPVHATATYAFRDTAELVAHFEGRTDREEYGRYGNPTTRAAEQKLAALDGGEDAALFSSGMAAVTTTLFTLLKAGDHVVMTRDCYRRARQFVATFLGRFGVSHTLVPPGDVAALEAAVSSRPTRLIISESPTNPYLRVADIPALAQVRRRHPGCFLVIDSTFATPINQRPLELGADLVLHSATKYLGGHNDLLAGAVCGNRGLVGAITDTRGVLGGVLDAHSSYLLIRGLKTLALRVNQQNRTALSLAHWLERHPAVQRVHHPFLPSHPDVALATAQMRGGGGVVSFEVKGGLEAASQVIDGCRLATLAPSLGGVETLIEQPALMSFFELTTDQRLAIGIKDNLIRLSVGIEDEHDIRADLERALSALQPELPGAGAHAA